MEKRTRTGNRTGAEHVGPNVFVKFFAGILILQTFAVFLFVIWYWWTTTDRSFGPAGIGLIMTSLFIAGAAANGLRARLVIEPDAVVVRDVFSTRRIKRSDISGSRTVYAGRWRGNELWIYDKSSQPVPIPSELQNQLLDDSWVAGLDDLDQADIKRNSDSFATDERLGETEGDRRWNGSAWQFWTNGLNLFSFAFLFMVVQLPFTEEKVRWPFILITMAIPVLAVGINVFTNGAVDLVNRGRDDGLEPSVPQPGASGTALAVLRCARWPLGSGVWFGLLSCDPRHFLAYPLDARRRTLAGYPRACDLPHGGHVLRIEHPAIPGPSGTDATKPPGPGRKHADPGPSFFIEHCLPRSAGAPNATPKSPSARRCQGWR